MAATVYAIGSLGCVWSVTIFQFMASRFVQAFGCSAAALLVQAIARDVLPVAGRGNLNALLAIVLAFPLAIMPILGGWIDQVYGWPAVFLLLFCIGALLFVVSAYLLPETCDVNHTDPVHLTTIARRFIADKQLLACGILSAACDGIQASYYAEGSFCLINILGLTPSLYGTTFLTIAAAGLTGGLLARFLARWLSPMALIKTGLSFMVIGTLVYLLGTLAIVMWHLSSLHSLVLILGCMMLVLIGIAILKANALGIALENYHRGAGTAAALFGLFATLIVSLFSFGMGTLHDGTLLPMPSYFFCITLLMVGVYFCMDKK